MISAFISCDGGSRNPATSDANGTAGSNAPSLLDGVRPAEIPANVKVACDEAETALRRMLGLVPQRRDGTFKDSFQGAARTGCRMLASNRDSTGTVKIVGSPLGLLAQALTKSGWADDLRYSADGAEGGTIGMRNRGVTCIMSAHTASADVYDFIADCSDDPVNLAEMQLPDWTIPALSEQIFSQEYSISPRMQMPPYIELDFNGDGAKDVAVPAQDMATGKHLFAIVLANTPGRPLLVDGNSQGDKDENYNWAKQMQVFHFNAENPTIKFTKTDDMVGDAIYLTGDHDRSALLYWNGEIAIVVYPTMGADGGD